MSFWSRDHIQRLVVDLDAGDESAATKSVYPFCWRIS